MPYCVALVDRHRDPRISGSMSNVRVATVLNSNRVIRDEAYHQGHLHVSPCGRTAVRVQQDSTEPELRAGQLVGVAFGRLLLPGDVVVSLDRSDGNVRVNRFLGYRRQEGQWVAVASGSDSVSADTDVPLERVLGRLSYADLTVTAMDRFHAACRYLWTASAKLKRRLLARC